jgi:fused signal recognition particle receptor
LFDQLRRVFSNAAKSIGQRELSEKDLNSILLDLQLGLLESDVAQEVIDEISTKLKRELVGLKLEKEHNAEELIRSRFQAVIAEMFVNAGELDIINRIKVKKDQKSGPFVIVFLGINGTGKTTTVAKFANLLRKNDISVVVAAADTHRAGAIEQLTQHAEKMSVKVVAQRYGADPSAVARDAVDYSRKHFVEAVLIDTAGRMQTAKNLMDEISKIVKVVKPDIKLFIGDSLAGNDTINQAREFFEYTKFDGGILTKADADVRGGSAISIVYITSKPIVYLGVGQGYDDLIPFDLNKFLLSIFGKAEVISVGKSAPTPTAAQEQERVPNVTVRPFPPSPAKTSTDETQKPIVRTTTPMETSTEFRDPAIEVKAPTTEHRDENTKPEPRLEFERTASRERNEEGEEPHFIKKREEDTPVVEKKSRFGSIFSRRKKNKKPEMVEETDTKAALKKEIITDKKNDSRSVGQEDEEKEDHEDKEQKREKGKHDDDEKIVYLTDDDIEDLLE